MRTEKPFEVWETPDKKARFYFSHSDRTFTTGVLVIQPGGALPKHNRPGGCENLVQIAGTCKMTVFEMSDDKKVEKEVTLDSSEQLRMQKGQWHIHANPFDKVSTTFFKLDGDITEIMETLRTSNMQIVPKDK